MTRRLRQTSACGLPAARQTIRSAARAAGQSSRKAPGSQSLGTTGARWPRTRFDDYAKGLADADAGNCQAGAAPSGAVPCTLDPVRQVVAAVRPGRVPDATDCGRRAPLRILKTRPEVLAMVGKHADRNAVVIPRPQKAELLRISRVVPLEWHRFGGWVSSTPGTTTGRHAMPTRWVEVGPCTIRWFLWLQRKHWRVVRFLPCDRAARRDGHPMATAATPCYDSGCSWAADRRDHAGRSSAGRLTLRRARRISKGLVTYDKNWACNVAGRLYWRLQAIIQCLGTGTRRRRASGRRRLLMLTAGMRNFIGWSCRCWSV